MKIKLFFLIFFVLLFVSCSSSRKISTPKTNKVTITESPYKNVSPVQQVQHVKKLQKSNKSLNPFLLPRRNVICHFVSTVQGGSLGIF